MLDDELLEDEKLIEAISSGGSYERSLDILNTDRCTLARVAGRVAQQHGDFSFPGKLTFNLRVRVLSAVWHMLRRGLDMQLCTCLHP